jgi:4-amino-4-deoxy-L-arabinose transferase-like glycosyltransferase
MILGKANPALFPLVLLLLFALALRIIFFFGISPSDPFTYSSTAWDILQGQWNPAFFYEQTTRWGVLFPLAASYKLFGVNEASSMLWPLLTSLGTVAVAYGLARHLKDERAAVSAGIIVATFPLEIMYASQPMADCPLSFWLLLSLYCFVRGEAVTTGKRWFFLLCGIALALAYATKFVAVLIAPFFLLVLLRRRRIEWNWAWLALGFASSFAFEFILFHQLTGNGFARLELVLHDQASHAPITAGGFQLQNGVGLYLYWMFVDFHYVGVSFLALLTMLLHRLAKYRRTGQSILGNNWLPLLWALTLLLVLSVYPTSTKPYVPLYKIEVYLLMFSAPLLVLTAVWLSEYARKLQWAVLALIVLSSLPFVYLLRESYRAHGDNARAIFAFAQTHPDRPLYAHRSDQRLLQYFAGFQHNEVYKNFRLPQSEKELPPTPPVDLHQSYVAINQYLIDYHREDTYPPEILSPPANWRVVYTYQRPEHWLRRVGIGVAGYLQTNGWIGQATYQVVSRKFRNWSQTKAVVIYSAE